MTGSNSHFAVPDDVHHVTNNSPGNDNTVRLWDVQSGRQRAILGGHKWEIMGLAYWPKHSNLAAACSSTDWATDYADPRVVVYNLRTHTILKKFRLPPRPSMRGVALSTDARRLMVCRGNATLETWSLARGSKLPPVTLENTGGENFLWCVDFTADRRRVLGGTLSGAVYVWDTRTGKIIQSYLGHTRRVRCVAWSPDEKQIASGSDDGTVRVWDVLSASQLLCLTGHQVGIGASKPNERAVMSIAFSPHGHWLVSGGWDGTVHLWDPTTGKELRRYVGHTECVRAVAVSPDGRLVASASDDKTVRIWQLPSARTAHKALFRPGTLFKGTKTWTRSGRGPPPVGAKQPMWLAITDVKDDQFRGTLRWPEGQRPIKGTANGTTIEWSGDGVPSESYTATLRGRTLEGHCGNGTIELFETRP